MAEAMRAAARAGARRRRRLPDARARRRAAGGARRGASTREWGGFGHAPKFPSPANLFFLLERARGDDRGSRDAGRRRSTAWPAAASRTSSPAASTATRPTTSGSCRTSRRCCTTTRRSRWLYAEASALAPAEGFERVARADARLRAARDDRAARAASSRRSTPRPTATRAPTTRGRPTSSTRPCSGPDGELFAHVYGFDGPPHLRGRALRAAPAGAARGERARRRASRGGAAARASSRGRRALLEARSRRERPLTDDKVLADWNGLMIGAMARAGARLAEPRYLDGRRRAAGFVLEHLRAPAGTLQHACARGRATVPGLLDDYAFLVEGLLQLHAATGEAALARRGGAPRSDEQEATARRRRRRRLLRRGRGPASALPRPSRAYDGAVASGNGVSALNLVELSRLHRRRRTSRRAPRRRCSPSPTAWRRSRSRTSRSCVRSSDSATAARRSSRRAAARTPGRGPRRDDGAGRGAGRRPAAAARRSRRRPTTPSRSRRGSAASDDEEWKPFQLELDVRRGLAREREPGGRRARGDVGRRRPRPRAERALPAGGDVGRRCRTGAGLPGPGEDRGRDRAPRWWRSGGRDHLPGVRRDTLPPGGHPHNPIALIPPAWTPSTRTN